MNTVKKLIGMALVPVSFILLNTAAFAEDDSLIATGHAMTQMAQAEVEEAVRQTFYQDNESDSAFALPQDIVESESAELADKINQAVLAGQEKKVAHCGRCRKRSRVVYRRKSYLVRRRRSRTIMVARRRVTVSYVRRTRYRTVYRPVRQAYTVLKRVRRSRVRYVPRTRRWTTYVRRTRLVRKRVYYRPRRRVRRRVSTCGPRRRARRVVYRRRTSCGRRRW